MFQHVDLFQGSIRENIAFVEALPDGYDTQAGIAELVRDGTLIVVARRHSTIRYAASCGVSVVQYRDRHAQG